jgi:uncharacterized membrane protein
VQVHSDVAEFYFQFVGAINPQHIGQVEVELELPRNAVLAMFGHARTATGDYRYFDRASVRQRPP